MSDLPELRKRLIAGAVWSVLIADHHADTLTPRQIERLYDASNAMRKADAALQKLAELEAGIRKVRDGYASQAKFCDIEALGYFREFLRRIDAVLPSPPKGDVA